MAVTLWEKFRPAAALLFICGSFPFSGVFGSSRPAFRFCTFPFLYSILVLSLSIYFSMGVFQLQFDQGSIEEYQEGAVSKFHSVVHYILITDLPLLSLFYQFYYLAFGNGIANLFLRFEKTVVHCTSNLPRWIPTIAINTIVVMFLIRFFFFNDMRLGLLLEYQFYYEALVGFNSASIAVLTLAFCLELAETLHEIRVDSDGAVIQAKYADVWMLAGELGDTLTYPILVSLLNNFLIIFTELYNVLYSMLNSCSADLDAIEVSESVLNLLQQFIRLFLLSFGPYYIQKKANGLYEALLEERGRRSEFYRKSEREETLTFIKDHPIRICLAGYFHLGRSVLVGMLDAVVTYMVILLQFDVTGGCTVNTA